MEKINKIMEQAKQTIAVTSPSSVFIENLLAAASQSLKAIKTSAPDCPSPELVLAYAFDELGAKDKKIIATHVHQCIDCLDMVIAARAAEKNSGDGADIQLPAWLKELSANPSPSPLKTQAFPQLFYASVEDMINDIKKHWGNILEWPETVREFLNFEIALLAASFKPETVPGRASDYAGEAITAKWFRLGNGKFTDIKPLDVRIHRMQITGNRLKISGELPEQLKEAKISLIFGWRIPDASITDLTFETWEILDGFFSSCLIAEKPLDPEGQLKMLVIEF